MLRAGEVKALLAVEIILQHGKRYACTFRDHSRRSSVKPARAEYVQRGRNDPDAGFDTACISTIGGVPPLCFGARPWAGGWFSAGCHCGIVAQSAAVCNQVTGTPFFAAQTGHY